MLNVSAIFFFEKIKKSCKKGKFQVDLQIGGEIKRYSLFD